MSGAGPHPPHPVRALLARHLAVLRAAWALRHDLAGPRRLADEAAFLPAALSLQETPLHPTPRRLAWALIALFVIALVWALVGEVDIVAVAPGRIVVSEHTKTIQPLETSVVRRVRVNDGQRVQAGQVLVELDPTLASADRAAVQELLAAAASEELRSAALLQALRSGAAPGLPADAAALARSQLAAEWQDLQARFAKADAEVERSRAEIGTVGAAIAKLEATLPLVQARESDYKALAEQGFVAAHATQDRSRERIEAERELVLQRARLAAAAAALAEAQRGRTALATDAAHTLHERHAQARTRRLQLTQDRTKADQREQLTRLTAPVAGVVQQLAVHAPGSVVTPAQPLMVVVPEAAEVTADVEVANLDIGFVKTGQAAEVKLETFPYVKYGTVPATVTVVSADAVVDEKKGAHFQATLVLGRSDILIDGTRVRLSPGMNLTAEVKTGRRRIIEYLLSPIQQAGHESLRER